MAAWATIRICEKAKAKSAAINAARAPCLQLIALQFGTKSPESLAFVKCYILTVAILCPLRRCTRHLDLRAVGRAIAAGAESSLISAGLIGHGVDLTNMRRDHYRMRLAARLKLLLGVFNVDANCMNANAQLPRNFFFDSALG